MEAAELIKLLIERGADPHVRNKERLSPLEVAERSENEEVVRLLQQAGTEKR